MMIQTGPWRSFFFSYDLILILFSGLGRPALEDGSCFSLVWFVSARWMNGTLCNRKPPKVEEDD